ncbi:PAS sensor protein, partial [Streptomyces antimycoticus]
MATVDDHGVATGWSEGARRLLGDRAQDVVGRAAGELRAERTVGDAAGGAGPCLAEEPRWSGRIALCHRDGHRMEVELLAQRAPPNWTRPPAGSPGWRSRRPRSPKRPTRPAGSG